MNKLQVNQLITSLYKAVDKKDLNYLESILAEHVNFRIGNFDTITDKRTALDANKKFFGSIDSMKHSIDKIWSVDKDILCSGMVDYIRHDGTGHSAYFSTQLTLIDGKITEYFVYADISGL
ncbi:nuclear transport factor 2 family protein [Moritella dasanensis]|uniref:nuclear transport factor 2 family protein n=1 Tax=Moritella dasanensis TaxID=428031 RepID=UPI000377D4FD|nr:nuclear transport factor 2 family protein [Moritella dasanensis]